MLLKHELASVDVDDLTGDEFSALASQIEASLGYVVGVAGMLDGETL